MERSVNTTKLDLVLALIETPTDLIRSPYLLFYDLQLLLV
jgi:hypothetical protein